MEFISISAGKELDDKLKLTIEQLRPPGSARPEWERYELAVEQLNNSLDYPQEFAQLQALLAARGAVSQACSALCLEDWLHYFFELLRSHELLVTSPVFKRFKVSRYEMLERFDTWLAQYQEISDLSGVKVQQRLVLWSDFIRCFHIRKLNKYLAGFWVQWHGMQPSDARKLLDLMGLRTKASDKDLQTLQLPWPPGFESKAATPFMLAASDQSKPMEATRKKAATKQEDEGQVLMLFQAVYDNGASELHHCEGLMRLNQKGRLQLPNQFLTDSGSRSGLVLQGLQVLASRVPHLQCPVAVNIQAEDVLNPRFMQALQRLVDRVSNPADLILEFECGHLAQHERQLAQRMHQLYDLGCQFSLDNCGLGLLPSVSMLEFFSVMKLHPGLLHESQRDITAKLMLSDLNDYAKNMGILTVAKQVDSPEIFQLQKKLGFDLAQGFHLAVPSLHPPSRPADAGQKRSEGREVSVRDFL